MGRIVAAFNMTIDGFCDHTAGIANEEVHRHYEDLLNSGDAALYGRVTFELMKFWQGVLKEPSGEASMNDFAKAIDRIPKIVFSNTMKTTGWDTAKLAEKSLEATARDLRKEEGRDVFVGSRSLIVQLANLNLIDEYQLCVHPVVVGKGLPLFDAIKGRTLFDLVKTRSMASGHVILYYTQNNSENS